LRGHQALTDQKGCKEQMASLDSQDGLDHVAGGDERVCPGEWAREDLLASLVILGRKD